MVVAAAEIAGGLIMKFLIEKMDYLKCQNVLIAFDVEQLAEGNAVITMVCSQKRKDGIYEIFHQDQFATPE